MIKIYVSCRYSATTDAYTKENGFHPLVFFVVMLLIVMMALGVIIFDYIKRKKQKGMYSDINKFSYQCTFLNSFEAVQAIKMRFFCFEIKLRKR